MAVVLAIALACRLLVVADMPTLSDDAYRFVWDGRVQAAGVNPYAHPPASPSLFDLRDYRIFPQVNRPYTRTGYPPTNEVAFYAINRVAGEGTTEVKSSPHGRRGRDRGASASAARPQRDVARAGRPVCLESVGRSSRSPGPAIRSRC